MGTVSFYSMLVLKPSIATPELEGMLSARIAQMTS